VVGAAQLAARPVRTQGLSTPLLWRGALDRATAERWLAELARHEAGSLRLADVLDVDGVIAALAPQLRAPLGAQAQLLVSQCWVRRARPPHGWHQDGALHARFTPGEALLPIHTCWLALTDCGIDAPGLEWIDAPQPEMLPPSQLTDAAVQAMFAPQAFVRPALKAGDAVFFDGTLLHRTHVTPHMPAERTSIELRFVEAGLRSPRLAGERLRPAFRSSA
jgi:ectoine hydroxylase-related dioxygenase (phytanoyl-CoA dioxygenase family)